MKKIIALIIVMLILQLEGLLASPVHPVDSVGVKWVSGKKFIEHKVEEHEGWYGIARQYGISYNDLRAANKDSSDKLTVGQIILVPVTKVKINDAKTSASKEESPAVKKDNKEPVFYQVKQKETLYAIAKKNHVTAAEIKKWNHLKTASMKKGEKIIVGYKINKAEHVQTRPSDSKSEGKIEKSVVTEKQKPELKPDSFSIAKTSPENKITADSQSVANKTFIGKGRKEVSEQGVATWIDDENINPHKYFALHRTAAAGSIIKVTNRMNKRSIFVKVVGKLPDTGDNDNIIIKISKASAEKLGVRDQRFQCELAYRVNEK